MKYFYIILKNKVIYEIEYEYDLFKNLQDDFINKKVLSFKVKGSENNVVVNHSDISQILDSNAYNNFVRFGKTKEYIKNGGWYNGKTHDFIRYEDWRKLEIQSEDKKTEEKELPKEVITKKMVEVRSFLKERGVI